MKKYIINISLVIAVILGSSCSDWLDVEPKDKNLEGKQFSSEIGINNVLNGIYIGMSSKKLYGGNMSQTTIEHLAHYYYVPSTDIGVTNTNYSKFYVYQSYDYNNDVIKDTFKEIWTDAYALIFRINNFIANVENTTVVTPEKRDILLGEAYALRAFLHLDLFRLYGPIYRGNSEKKSLPYNDKSQAETYPVLTAAAFMDRVLSDIETAERLLENDPILKEGILNPNDEEGLSSVDKFEKYARNKRLNLIAVRALHARVLVVADRLSEAADIARDLINLPGLIEPVDRVNSNAIFTWVKSDNITADKEKDYIFKTEVLFSIHNIDLYSNWTEFTESATNGKTYSVHITNIISNIFGEEKATSIGESSDLRIKQWSAAIELGANQYVSIRYKKFGNIEAKNSIRYMQPLMRMTELFYLILEDEINKGKLDSATELADLLMIRRGYKDNELYKTTASELALREFLLKEYYREFYAEGQAFFYLKRIESDVILNSNGTKGYMDMDLYDYVVPLPDTEKYN
ncbi:RagB/SusD family nutrient uptake outer membrane protein [Dysgonomonas sp. Marseille-P4677]|uniref:RagB/SusD family nutrient uptake outer membrane protein n=1 Tax=Dysgonomonas sp. Marseille-P4677 TaxID=2364790 RepID=UPI001911E9FC|nr:RagB/SusD family nutrient uptake outer membrane protein [Dysgonomonas sp. Marseille-P4677]MBK5720354.1 RagB/SusD family nutrient uptake outer membrane protein [Dysgonomonas sp. Marseille-P4677]